MGRGSGIISTHSSSAEKLGVIGTFGIDPELRGFGQPGALPLGCHRCRYQRRSAPIVKVESGAKRCAAVKEGNQCSNDL